MTAGLSTLGVSKIQAQTFEKPIIPRTSGPTHPPELAASFQLHTRFGRLLLNRKDDMRRPAAWPRRSSEPGIVPWVVVLVFIIIVIGRRKVGFSESRAQHRPEIRHAIQKRRRNAGL